MELARTSQVIISKASRLRTAPSTSFISSPIVRVSSMLPAVSNASSTAVSVAALSSISTGLRRVRVRALYSYTWSTYDVCGGGAPLVFWVAAETPSLRRHADGRGWP
jgi:hypothetical protein